MIPLFALLYFLLTGVTVGDTSALGSIEAHHGVIYYTPPDGATQSFMDIRNNATVPDTLTSAACPIANATQMVDVNGKPAASLTIAPGQTVSLTAKGTHLALQSVHFRITYGSVVPCMLNFANAGEIQILLYASPLPGKPLH